MLVEAGVCRSSRVALRAIAGQGNEDDATSELVTNASRELVPVHARKTDVENRERRTLPLDDLERGRPVVRLEHTVALQRQRDRQTLARVGVVFDDEDRLSTIAWSGIGLGHVRLRRRDRRQSHRERGALSLPVAHHGNVTAVQRRQSLHQRQANAEPARRSIHRGVALEEQIEDAIQIVCGDTLTIVADFDDRILPFM